MEAIQIKLPNNGGDQVQTGHLMSQNEAPIMRLGYI